MVEFYVRSLDVPHRSKIRIVSVQNIQPGEPISPRFARESVIVRNPNVPNIHEKISQPIQQSASEGTNDR